MLRKVNKTSVTILTASTLANTTLFGTQPVADHSSLLQQQEGQEKKVAVVTGAGGTIGSQVVDLLHSFDFKCVAICDLSDLRQVYKAADQIRSNYQRIEMLVCVAGTMLEPNSNSHPANRVEPHLMVNLLSHVQLFTRLRPLLEASLYDQPRAIFVSSATSHAGCVSEF
uniref:Uncharacterized protein n=1 Tax=Ditylenchus dipsaci TaxID=166011 RepID=A0A915DVV4_9BILA